MKKNKKLWKRRKMLISDARQIPRPGFATNKASNVLSAIGIRYEKKLKAELEKLVDFEVYHNPWFLYNESEYCSPDFILWPTSDQFPLIIIECKLKYVKEGTDKLKNLYLPVVKKALKLTSEPIGIVITKSLTPEVKSTISDLRSARADSDNTLLWLLNGRISW